MHILGGRVVLRAIEAEDVDALHRWSNDPDVQHGLGGWHFPLSRAGLVTWVANFRADANDQRMVIDVPGRGAVGLVTMTAINWKDRNAFHGILVGDASSRRQGIATDAVNAIMRYAFLELGLERLDTTIVEFNEPSLALHVDRCGWSREGRKENAVFRNGRYWANVILGVTREAYLARNAATVTRKVAARRSAR